MKRVGIPRHVHRVNLKTVFFLTFARSTINVEQLRKTLSIMSHFGKPTCTSHAVICHGEELHKAVVWWRTFSIHRSHTSPKRPLLSGEINVWKRYWIFAGIPRSYKLQNSMSFDRLNERLDKWNTVNGDVLRRSLESVYYCGFGVISSLCLLVSLFELSSTHCPAPRVLASLAVFKKNKK